MFREGFGYWSDWSRNATKMTPEDSKCKFRVSHPIQLDEAEARRNKLYILNRDSLVLPDFRT